MTSARRVSSAHGSRSQTRVVRPCVDDGMVQVDAVDVYRAAVLGVCGGRAGRCGGGDTVVVERLCGDGPPPPASHVL